jgi:hypothetical protein
MKTQNRKTILAFVTGFVLVLNSASASPQSRAQIAKGLLLQRITEDGWQLVQESQSLLRFERRSGFGQTFLMHLMTGANGTWAVERMSITIIPATDHWTNISMAISVNSQNALGQTTSVPIKNAKTDTYLANIARWVAARMPAEYKSIKP